MDATHYPTRNLGDKAWKHRDGRRRYDLGMRRRVLFVTFILVVGLGNGVFLGKTLASPRQAPRTTTTSSTVVTRTCVSVLPTGRLCKTVVRIGSAG
jgi:hypothetical protein